MLNMRVDDFIDVTVKKVHPSYVLIDYEGAEATLQITELTWNAGRFVPHDYVQEGQQITVVVTAMFDDRFSVSLKRVHPEDDPWFDPPEIGMQLKSPVVVVADYGYFFELSKNLHGLLLSENASQQYAQNELVYVRIKEVDTQKKRVTLEEC